MQLHIEDPVLALQEGQVVRLDDAAGRRIVSCGGTVWVTEEGVQKDHILGPGQALVIGRAGRTLVQALQPACISIH